MRGLERARHALGRFARPAAPMSSPPDGYEHPTVRLLFEHAHYCRQCDRAPADPLADYLHDGWRRRLDPHPLFSTAYYLDDNSDVADAGVCPLVHYARHGAGEGRRPHPLFDPGYYRDRYVDVSDPSIDALAHFVMFGGTEGRDPNPWFDSAHYLATSPDVAAAKVNPLLHYAVDGWREGRNPHRDFDVAFYRTTNPELAGREPLAHFLSVGWRARREPSQDFGLRLVDRRDGDVPTARCRLVVVTEEGRGPDPVALLARCPMVIVTTPARYEPRADDYVYAPDRPDHGLTATEVIHVALCLAHQRYDFVVVTRDRATGSEVTAASAANAVVVSAEGYERRRAVRTLRIGSVGRFVRLPVRKPTDMTRIAVDDLGLGALIRFGTELVVAGDAIVVPPLVARRRPPVPLLSAAGSAPAPTSLELAELAPVGLHEAMLRSFSA